MLTTCFTLLLCLSLRSVNASTCDYSEQVELSNIASTVQAKYEIKEVAIDNAGNIRNDISKEEIADENSEYLPMDIVEVNILNITQDIYVNVTNDQGFDKTYYYEDTNNGQIIINGGDLTQILRYKITIFSNKEKCLGESIRTVDVVTPMINPIAMDLMCMSIPDFTYCQEYITSSFLVSDDEIYNSVAKAYDEYLKKQQKTEEENNKNFIEKIGEFIKKNKTIIIIVTIGVIVIGAIVTFVIIRYRRNRLL